MVWVGGGGGVDGWQDAEKERERLRAEIARDKELRRRNKGMMPRWVGAGHAMRCCAMLHSAMQCDVMQCMWEWSCGMEVRILRKSFFVCV